MDYLLRSGRDEAASPYSNIGDQYYSPDTSDVVSAFTEESFQGAGTGYADVQAFKATQAQKQGEPLTEETYKTSPYYRSSIPYSHDITSGSAKVLADYNDEREKNGFIIGHASTAQKAAGFTAGFATGIFEPKNVAIGVGVSAVLTPIAGSLADAGGSFRRIMQLRKAVGRYGEKALIGGTEGLVSAAVQEPSNRYSASILKQDYTMSDSLLNIGLSAAFGVGFATAPGFIKEKWQKHGGNTPEVIAHEMDAATGQLATGRKVDVNFIDYTLKSQDVFTPEKAAAILEVKPKENIYADVDTKIATMTVEQQNLRLDSLNKKMEAAIIKPKEIYEREALSVINQKDAAVETQGVTLPQWKDGLSKKTIDNLNNPASFIIREKATGKAVMETANRDIVSRVNTAKYEAVPILEHLINQNGQTYIKNSVDVAQTVNKAILDSVNPENDTALDIHAAKELDAFDTALSPDEAAIKTSYDSYLKEIAFMKKEGMMTDAEIEMFTDAINSVNEKDIQSGYDALLACLTRG